ncbi:MAG: hypothetical protein M3O86_05575, partial [Actinomycetota bacterium]|nr:hypothetical protein [Actinomycetota bacterium]
VDGSPAQAAARRATATTVRSDGDTADLPGRDVASDPNAIPGKAGVAPTASHDGTMASPTGGGRAPAASKRGLA